MSRPRVLAFALCTACNLLIGCALLTKAEPLVPRYYTPEEATSSGASATTTKVLDADVKRLSLGEVRGGVHLRDRIAYRDSPHELGFYEDRRWTERPELYLRRSLERLLFEQQGLVRVISGEAPVLEVELVAFEEIRAPKHQARVQVVISLANGRTDSLQQSITVVKDVSSKHSGDEFDATVDALATALQECVQEIADHVGASLATLAADERQTVPAEH